MRPIRVAIIFDQNINAGGGFQQALNAALLVREISHELIDPIYLTTIKENISVLSGYGVGATYIGFNFFQKIRGILRRAIQDSRIIKIIKKIERHSPFEKKLVERAVDLVYFVSPSRWARDLEEINYITTVWDLCHRDDPEFPEVRFNREHETRDKNFGLILPRATAILVDSELGKYSVALRYGVDEGRIYVMPFQPACSTRRDVNLHISHAIDVRLKYQLDVPYIFYPAQFWAHKNHAYLLEGLIILEKSHGIKIGAIFSGGDKGNRGHVENIIQQLKLSDRVRFAGFVSDNEMLELYQQSLALVMPTYFGPTNLPPLEAFQLGVPVLYSDKAGLRDQVGDAALLMDLTNPESMAFHLKNLIENPLLRESLIQRGYNRLEYYDSLDRVGVLRKIIQNFRFKRICWA